MSGIEGDSCVGLCDRLSGCTSLRARLILLLLLLLLEEAEHPHSTDAAPASGHANTFSRCEEPTVSRCGAITFDRELDLDLDRE